MITVAQLNYSLQGEKKLQKKQRNVINKVPDISLIKGIRINSKTIIYPKTQKRYDEIIKSLNIEK